MFLNEKGRRGRSAFILTVYYFNHILGILRHEYQFIHYVILEKESV